MTLNKTIKTVIAGASILISANALSQEADVERLNIVSCPIIRDTEMVPCWLTEHEGELYYLGITLDLQSPFHPPELKHQALIEGVVNRDAPRICGGIVLEPVKVASLPELDLSCQTMLPAEGHHIDFARRGTGPDPARLSAQNQALARQYTPPAPPYIPETYTIYYDFDSDFMPTRSNRNITEAMRYAAAINASKIEITAYRGAALLSNGEVMHEKEYLPQRRAEAVHYAIVDIGAPADIVSSTWVDVPDDADGIDDYMTRRVTITVSP